MRKGLIVSALLFCAATISHAQESQEKTGFDKSKMFIGGYLGLSFSSYSTIINVTPQVGYQFNQYFAAGVGLNYVYYNYQPYVNSSARAVRSYLGFNIFGRLYPIRVLFIQAQPEFNYVWGNYVDNYGQEVKIPNQFVPSLLLGGGAFIPAGKGALVISLMYDVIQNIYSPYYGQAVFSFGYSFGF